MAEFVPPPSATPKRAKRQPVTVAEEVEIFVTEADLLAHVRANAVRVHKHGSGKYKGGYLALRPAGGRRAKRPYLASGRPERLKDYLAALGVHLCLRHRELSLTTCTRCGRS